MEPTQYLATIRKAAWAIAALALAGAVIGYLTASSQPDQFRATSKVFVSLEQGETVTELVQGSAYTQNLVQSYVQLATMPVVLEPVIEELGLETTPRALARTVSAQAPLDTVIIEVSAVSPSPTEARDVADAVVAELSEAVRSVSPTGPDDQASVRLSTVADAPLPENPFAPNKRLATATGLGIGVLLGLLYAVVREALDTRVSGPRDVQRVTSAAILGSIGTEPRKRRGSLVMRTDPLSPTAEAYRRLRTNLQFLGIERRLRSIVVTSAVASEGKSGTAINLALAVAEGPGRVLLIDADLRRPSVARYTGLEGAAGLTTVLIGQVDVDSIIQPWGSPNLDVITAGEVPPNPSQLLSSPAMKSLLDSLVERYDLVIIDSPPLLPVADPAIVSRLADGALVVAGARRLRRHQLADALNALESSGGTCLGVVLNRLKNVDGAVTYSYVERQQSWRRRWSGSRPGTPVAPTGAGHEVRTPTPDARAAQSQPPATPARTVTAPEPGPGPADEVRDRAAPAGHVPTPGPVPARWGTSTR